MQFPCVYAHLVLLGSSIPSKLELGRLDVAGPNERDYILACSAPPPPSGGSRPQSSVLCSLL